MKTPLVICPVCGKPVIDCDCPPHEEEENELPQEVQAKIDILNNYAWNDDLSEFDIIHLYPGEIAYPDGYYDARFFEAVIFNTKTMQKRSLGKRHDAINFHYNCIVRSTRVYADGSFLLQLVGFVKIQWDGQAIDVESCL